MDIKEVLEDPRLELTSQNITNTMVTQFSDYLELLVKWNQKINLTSEKTALEILQRHIFDSLQYARVIFPNEKVVDIGSGGGFPGIPLKIIYPELTITLIDSQGKRCSFLEAVILNLGLKGINVVNQRAEDIQSEGLVEAVIFRAVSDIQTCLYLASPFLGEGGKVVLKKNHEEIKDALNPADGFSLKKKLMVTGFNDKHSSLMVFEKSQA
ncbi:MAG: 16S rRNA (guanine(527)-N(7))-methyltransferase RsmG [Nitrospinota bacterium]